MQERIYFDLSDAYQNLYNLNEANKWERETGIGGKSPEAELARHRHRSFHTGNLVPKAASKPSEISTGNIKINRELARATHKRNRGKSPNDPTYLHRKKIDPIKVTSWRDSPLGLPKGYKDPLNPRTKNDLGNKVKVKTRPARELMSNPLGASSNIRKFQREDYEIVVDYLISEGYTGSVEGAGVILNNMSEAWYNIIVEKSTSDKISDLRKVMDSELKTVDTKNPNQKQVNKIKHLRSRLKTLEVHRKGESALDGQNKPARITQKEKESKSSPLTAQDRKDLRDTRSKVPTGSPEERAQTRANISSRKVASHGTTPQSTKMNVAPVSVRTRAQRRATASADAMVGNLDPTYRDREGNAQRLISQGESERTYSKGISARYQQGATGSGTRGATPAGSTIDPNRPRPRRVR
jgi:hypothetical protein